MAKIVSEKREILNSSTQNTVGQESEPSATPLVNLLGLALVALFVLGAVAMVFFTLKA